MHQHCIKNFLKSYDPTHVERHSDSSDFESTNDVPPLSSKFGNHGLEIDETRYDRPEKDYRVYQALTKKRHYNTKPKGNNRDGAHTTRQQKIKSPNPRYDVPEKHMFLREITREKEVKSRGNNQNSGDQNSSNLTKWCHSKSIIRNKVMPGLSTIFRRSNNCKEQMECIQEDSRSKKTDRDKVCCPYCKRKALTKKGESRKIPLQPVYTMNQNIHRYPGYGIPYSVHHECTAKIDSTIVKNSPNLDVDNNYTSSDSEIEIIKNHKNRTRNNTMKRRLENEMRKECAIMNNISRCQQQQFPSKSQLQPSCQVFTSTSCQVKCESIDVNKVQNVSSASSTLWNFLTNKIKVQTNKTETAKTCHCPKPLEPCKPETCRFQNKIDEIEKLPKSPQPFLNESDSSYSNKQVTKKKPKSPQVICKCSENKKEKGSKTIDAQIQKDETRKCQENHDDITASLAQKYNGEILCIHNPPCILINGCLNLPTPKIEVQENLWPVTQTKKSSFAQMCRKIKRTIDNKSELEQSSQYHPPYTNIKQCLPEFGREKVIQSVCNHNPPCEVVHGCYKAKYDPRLQNSCIHVPSCNKVPECLLGANTCQKNSCIHKPRCTELPLCSRKYLILTAKENVSTQMQPKTKICRHEPPCLLIPKCLAHTLYDDYIPVGAIPGCRHQPSCEMIPACCRKSAKEMVSVQSQYPHTSCRIV